MVSTLWLLVVAASTGWTAGQETDYCSFTPEHTLCKFSGRGPRCGPQVRGSGVSRQDAAAIVALHNQLRSQVARGEETRGAPGPQPSGANIRTMVWDEELATLAQRHADQCVFEHECPDCRRVARFAVGQNLFISFQSNLDLRVQWSRAILGWYNEVADFSNSSIQPFQFTLQTGHYTQMLWWDTSRIGCGFTMFLEDGWWKKLYTCNYGPAGNIIFNQMYLRGAPCSACPADTSCSLEYPGLCEASDDFDFDVDSSSTAVPPTPSQDDINTIFGDFKGFSGLININSITPNDVDLAALLSFFNNRRRPGLITAAPTTPLAAGPEGSESLVNAAVTLTTSSSAAIDITAPVADDSDDVSVNTTLATLIVSTGPNAATSNETRGESLTATTQTSSLPTSLASAATSPSPAQSETFAPVITTSQESSMEDDTSSDHSETSSRRTEEPEAERVTPDLGELRNSEEGMSTDSTRNNQEPMTLMSFLRRAGTNTQVIRTSSLNNVYEIIQTLPEGTKPIVLFRTRSGQLTELDPTSLSPIPSRPNRSTSRRVPEPARLLTCDMDMSPCKMSPAGGKWTVAKSLGEGRHTEIQLAEGEEAEVLVKEMVKAPPSGVACVTFTHRRDLMSVPTNTTISNTTTSISPSTVTSDNILPELQVGVMPLGQEASHKSVLGVSGLWEMSRTTFRDLVSPFVVMVTVGPAPSPARVGLDALTVTDGPCCLSGRC